MSTEYSLKSRLKAIPVGFKGEDYGWTAWENLYAVFSNAEINELFELDYIATHPKDADIVKITI